MPDLDFERSSKTVLIVDDNEQQLKLFECYAMSFPEAASRSVQTLEEAIALIGSSPPDLVLLDNRLHPYADYRETVPQIWDAGYLGKIVVVSADIIDPIFAKLGEFDVVGLIDKCDFSLKTYRHLISKYLN